jgi:DnaJ-class molecular chaperone
VAEDPNVHPHWAAETKLIAQNLDQLDYFQVLGATPDAPLDELKAKYHQLQRNYHPDAFYTSPDQELKVAVGKIAKRVAEAYVILRDAQKRSKYTKDILGPDRAKKLRFSEEMEHEARIEKQQEQGKTAQGRNLWKKAQENITKGDYKAAARDLKTALLFEKGNEMFTKKLAEVEELAKSQK